MALLELNAQQLLRIFMRLMPRGRIWSRSPASVQGRTLATLMPTYQRLMARDNNLVGDAFPATAYELLPDWEESLGLPDPCAGTAPGLQQRRQQVVARLTASGGQSRAYFINYAAALGYTVTIKEYDPFRMGRRLGARLGGDDWNHTWAIQAPLTTVTPFRMGRSGMGERFRTWGNAVLECELTAIKPSHTILLFQYI